MDDNKNNTSKLFKIVYEILLKIFILILKELLYKDNSKIEKKYDEKMEFIISKNQQEDLKLNNISYITNSNYNSVSTTFNLGNNKYNNLKFNLEFKLKDNIYIKIPKNKEGKNLDFGILYDKSNQPVGILYIDTEFNFNIEIINNDIILLFNNINIYQNDNKEIKIKLMLTSYEDYFSYTEWIERKNITSLSLKYKQNLITSKSLSEKHAKILDSWFKICNMHSKDENWQNEVGLKNQYLCHFKFAKMKNPWNIEPFRKNKGYYSTVVKLCNP